MPDAAFADAVSDVEVSDAMVSFLLSLVLVLSLVLTFSLALYLAHLVAFNPVVYAQRPRARSTFPVHSTAGLPNVAVFV